MVNFTITFDEKFDLEEGELKINFQEAGYEPNNYFFNDFLTIDEINEYNNFENFTIDNSGDVTVLNGCDFGGYDCYQIGYFVDDELVKATKHIHIPSSNGTYNISDLECFLFYFMGSGESGAYFYESDEYIDEEETMYRMESIVWYPNIYGTMLPGHYDTSNIFLDYDFLDLDIQMQFGYYDYENEEYAYTNWIGPFKIRDLEISDEHPDGYMMTSDTSVIKNAGITLDGKYEINAEIVGPSNVISNGVVYFSHNS